MFTCAMAAEASMLSHAFDSSPAFVPVLTRELEVAPAHHLHIWRPAASRRRWHAAALGRLEAPSCRAGHREKEASCGVVR